MTPDSSLWAPESQAERLNELMAADPALKEAPLRRDVRSLGQVLGRVLREQEGDAFFEQVELVRTSAIAHRDEYRNQTFDPNTPVEHGSHLGRAAQLIRDMPVHTAYRLARAFATYFELTNLAETNHRKRRRRALLADRERRP